MATSIRDVALLLSVLAGYDGFDPRMTPETPLRTAVPHYHALVDAEIDSRTAAGTWTATSAATGLRVGIIKESLSMPGVDPEIASAIQDAASRFAVLGGTVDVVSIPQHAYAPHVFAAVLRLHATDTFLNPAPSTLSYPFLTDHPALHQAWYDNMTKSSPAAVETILSGGYLSDRRHFPESTRRKVLSHVHELRAAYDRALQSYDVLITPANPTAGMKHANVDGLGVKGMADFVLGNTANTCPFNISGHPGLVIPVAWGVAGVEAGKEVRLPVGMQIIGRRWGEEKLFLAASAWEVGGKWLDGGDKDKDKA
jgi:amidase